MKQEPLVGNPTVGKNNSKYAVLSFSLLVYFRWGKSVRQTGNMIDLSPKPANPWTGHFMGVHTVVYPKIRGAPTPRSHSDTAVGMQSWVPTVRTLAAFAGALGSGSSPSLDCLPDFNWPTATESESNIYEFFPGLDRADRFFVHNTPDPTQESCARADSTFLHFMLFCLPHWTVNNMRHGPCIPHGCEPWTSQWPDTVLEKNIDWISYGYFSDERKSWTKNWKNRGICSMQEKTAGVERCCRMMVRTMKRAGWLTWRWALQLRVPAIKGVTARVILPGGPVATQAYAPLYCSPHIPCKGSFLPWTGSHAK